MPKVPAALTSNLQAETKDIVAVVKTLQDVRDNSVLTMRAGTV